MEILSDHIVEHIVISKSRDKATGIIAVDRTKKERKKKGNGKGEKGKKKKKNKGYEKKMNKD